VNGVGGVTGQHHAILGIRCRMATGEGEGATCQQLADAAQLLREGGAEGGNQFFIAQRQQALDLGGRVVPHQ
jgi:hypothetical protein